MKWSIKAYISNILRYTHLLPLADWIRFQLVRLKNFERNNAFSNEYPEIKIPPDYFLYETYVLNYSNYYFDGLDTAKEIIQLICSKYNINNRDANVLDWGCGPGRIVRHIPDLLPSSNIYATDFNNKYVTWCNKNIERVIFSTNDITPPMSYSSDFFDLIIGLSIFTHLSEEYHLKWAQELARVLKPGGMAFITTQGNAYRDKLSVSENTRFNSGNLVVREHAINGNRLFSTFHPVSFVKAMLEKEFDILEHYPGLIVHNKGEQDKWLIKKKYSIRR